MRTSHLRQGTPWALVALCWATSGCLIQDPETKTDGPSARAGDARVDVPPGGGSGGAGGGQGGGTGGGGAGGSGGGGAGGSNAGGMPGTMPDVAPPDLVDAAGTCSTDDDCKTLTDTPTCVVGKCARCAAAQDCAGRTGKAVCDTMSGRCEQCVGSDGCDKGSTTPICSPSHTCVRCGATDAGAQNDDCKGNAAGLFCGPAGSCVECLAHSDCKDPMAPICAANKCAKCTTNDLCKMRNGATAPACDMSSGACVECTADSFCSGTKPICKDQRCAPCAADNECVSKQGPNPGVCMSHIDGHCATDAETVYVKNGGARCATNTGGDGSNGSPFCQPQDGIKATSTTKSLLVLRGPDPLAAWTVASGGNLSVVGQDAVVGPGASVGVHITGRDVYIRGVTIRGFTQAGIVADGNAVLRLDRCIVTQNSGGVLVNTAGFSITNTVIAGNKTGSAPDGNFFGGVSLRSAAGKPTTFKFNTIVDNETGGLGCAGPYKVQALLVANNGAGGDVAMCATDGTSKIGLAPNFDPARAFHLTASSPCLNASDPLDTPFDIDGDSRPQGAKSDCGADELK